MKNDKMKAIVCTEYGGPEVLQLKEVAKPKPADGEVLVKTYAVSITRAGTMMRTGYPLMGRLFLGLTKPKHPISGTEFAGVVESVGKGVSKFKVGDSVFGSTLFDFGTYAEYVCINESGVITKKPESVSFEQISVVCDGYLTSYNFLKKVANIQKGQKVLINGASGSLGTAAIQLAKHFGAEVTGVCSSRNIDLVKTLGVDHVIDYNTTDFTQEGKLYDIIYDTVGKSSFVKSKKALSASGIYMTPILGFSQLIQMVKTSLWGSKKAMFTATGTLPVSEIKEIVNKIKVLFEKKKLTSVIEKSYALADAEKAHRYIDKGHKRGSIVFHF